jgi:hypothetical protein
LKNFFAVAIVELMGAIQHVAFNQTDQPMREFDLMLLSSYATLAFVMVVDIVGEWLRARSK